MSKLTKTGVPLYQQIYDDLLNRILNNEFSEGSVMPSEKKLQEKYQVSRITIRQSMDMLQRNGYIQKLSGTGTIVTSNKHILQLDKISSFSDDSLEHQISSKLIDFQIVDAPLKVANNLKLKSSSKVYLIERLRIVDNEIVGFHRVYIPKDVIKLNEEMLSNPKTSLYKLFEDNNIELANAHETIEAINADENLQQILNISENSALLNRSRSLFDEKDRAIEYVEMYYRADRYKYEVNLQRS